MSDSNSYIDFRAFERETTLSRRTFFHWIAQGRLAAYRPSPRKTLVKRSDVDRIIEASKAENPIDQIVDEVMAELGVGE
ncbi:MAG: helix-turn-helix transcriptional regulator [Candidatus Binatia bacterium]